MFLNFPGIKLRILQANVAGKDDGAGEIIKRGIYTANPFCACNPDFSIWETLMQAIQKGKREHSISNPVRGADDDFHFTNSIPLTKACQKPVAAGP